MDQGTLVMPIGNPAETFVMFGDKGPVLLHASSKEGAKPASLGQALEEAVLADLDLFAFLSVIREMRRVNGMSVEECAEAWHTGMQAVVASHAKGEIRREWCARALEAGSIATLRYVAKAAA